MLFVKVHYFVHLNFAFALLLGNVAFVAGIDTAVGHKVSIEYKFKSCMIHTCKP